ncbi:MAG: hypothetical protein IPN94_22945 [Sphingobacteriales bacterium]|nr:hypothetical protein [Sphingobacteriales bacterium]
MKKHILILFAFFVLHGCKTRNTSPLTNKGETTPAFQNTTKDSVKMLSYEEKMLKIKLFYQLLQGNWENDNENMAYPEKMILKVQKNKAYLYNSKNKLQVKYVFALQSIPCDTFFTQNEFKNDIFWVLKTKLDQGDSLSKCFSIDVSKNSIEAAGPDGLFDWYRP